MPPAWAFVFGALDEPGPDPVAVLSTLKNVDVPRSLQVEMQGEALFNDGVGIVLFTLLLSVAVGNGGEIEGTEGVVRHLLWEGGGGIAVGALTGYPAYLAMRAIDDFPLEVLITLALVSGTYAFAPRGSA